tara:strand:+ start:880 stop:1047 length:168 start_codon:yes stop_codon:yes gene_type:complete
MGAVKHWMMEMEEAMVASIENGAVSVEDVLTEVKSTMSVVDERFIKEKYIEIEKE